MTLPMITFLRGTLIEAYPNRAVLDVGGMGYDVAIPLSTFDALPKMGQVMKMLTHLVIREDEHILFGFLSEEERDLFRLLIGQVSGIGPKLGLAVLSGMAVSRFKGCVAQGDIAALSKIKGVGKKTAERIVLELRDKVGVASAWQASVAASANPLQVLANDATLALITLGYKQVDAHKAVTEWLKITPGSPTVSDCISGSLRLLMNS
jgi:holliday junction DNA helicase RuvA